MSGRIPRDFIDTVLARTDIVNLIDSRIPLRKMGANFAACCPFHQEKSPSFTVSPTKQFYHCFGCGVSGNALSFLIEYERLNFVEAVESLAGQLGMELPNDDNQKTPKTNYLALYQLMEQTSQYYQQSLRQHPEAIEYLKKRGLDGQLAKEFQIGFAPPGWDNLAKHVIATTEQLANCGLIIQKEEGGFYDRFRERIMFPIRDRKGNTIGFGGRTFTDAQPKYLNSPETVLFHKGRELYGLYEARRTVRDLQQLIIVEGYMDLLAIAQQGIRNVVATLGTATTEDHLKILLRCTSNLVFCFDGDRAGKEAAWRALIIALPLITDGVDLRFMFLPDDTDPDEFIRENGKDAFLQSAANAMPLSEFFFRHLSGQFNLSSIEGKAQLAKPAGEYLSQMPDSVFRRRMFDRLSELVRVERSQLQQLAGIKPNQDRPTIKQPKPQAPKPTPMRMAIALLIQHPELAKNVKNVAEIATINMPGIEILTSIINQLHQNRDLTTGMLLELWREHPESSLINKLAALSHPIPESGVHQEFDAILARLRQLHRSQQIEDLLTKANHSGLTPEEKKLLQELILANKNLEVM